MINSVEAEGEVRDKWAELSHLQMRNQHQLTYQSAYAELPTDHSMADLLSGSVMNTWEGAGSAAEQKT